LQQRRSTVDDFTSLLGSKERDSSKQLKKKKVWMWKLLMERTEEWKQKLIDKKRTKAFQKGWKGERWSHFQWFAVHFCVFCLLSLCTKTKKKEQTQSYLQPSHSSSSLIGFQSLPIIGENPKKKKKKFSTRWSSIVSAENRRHVNH